MASNGTSSSSQPLIPIFNGEKYEFWSIKMKTLFRSPELWDMVEHGFAEVKEPNVEEEEKLKSNEIVQDYLSRVSTLVNQVKSYGEQISDGIVVAKVLGSLTPKFEHVVVAIEEAHDLSTYSFDELMSSLQAYEERLQRPIERSNEKAFHAKQESSATAGRGRGNFHGRG
ncbi:uncharacterized protein LOC119995500 [Tripterygium wilfordii]|uniref:uncharacterized protein LOC119995500 n=1 Tax=Tripterygium wilfordii TaxID=458696 RepID=UPI0018F83569|nr:uncharacterized protein LOC119995500 [Tripterygium wilfordii]